jgi:predicted DNA-binding mobile mystery protein A
MESTFNKLRLSQLDRGLKSWSKLQPRPAGGWLSSIREALGLSRRQVAENLRASAQAVQQFERAEAEDRITLHTLRRTAAAMGCELVYVLVPTAGSFVDLAEKPTRERVARDVKSVIHTMALENQQPANASELAEDEVRRRLNTGKTP